RDDALSAKKLRGLFVEPIEIADRLRLGVDIDRVRNRRLHLEGEFIALDPGPHRRVVGLGGGGERIEIAEQIELGPLRFARDVTAWFAERKWARRIDRELHTAMLGAEVIRPVSADAAAAIGEGPSEHHKLGQILIQGAEAVMDPRTDRGERSLQRMPPRMEL